jgi:hypothetical protein
MLVRAASRAPDHMQLKPYRIVVIAPQAPEGGPMRGSTGAGAAARGGAPGGPTRPRCHAMQLTVARTSPAERPRVWHILNGCG